MLRGLRTVTTSSPRRLDHPAVGRFPYCQVRFGSSGRAWKQGQSAFEHAHGTDFWNYMVANAAENNSFNKGMTARAESIVHGIVAAYDFSPFARIVDVGGGAGVLLSRILEVHSASTGILYDIPAVTQTASACLAARGLSERAEVRTRDFLRPCPRGDLLVLMAILHDWDDERAALLLRQCRKALEPNDRILIIEDSQVRTLAEHEELLVREGFRLESVAQPTCTGGPQSSPGAASGGGRDE